MIPTAEEFIEKSLGINGDIKITQFQPNLSNVLFLMQKFAKMHVEAALKEAANELDNADIHEAIGIDRDSILNAYPLNLIK